MSKKLGKDARRLWAKLKRQFKSEGRRVGLTAFSVTGTVIALRLMGLLQSIEWATLDQFFRWRPIAPTDERIVIVGIDENDLQKIGTWPIPDAVMAELLQKISELEPRAIGLDIYRDLPVEPGHEQLKQVMSRIPNLVGIERIADKQGLGVPPPPSLQPDRVGFNNVVVDSDSKVRRSLLYLHTEKKAHKSFALQLALLYLQPENITPQPAIANPKYLQLGQGVFQSFNSNDGAYVRADNKGYQILADFQGGAGSFRTVSMSDVLEGKVPPNFLRDRIVLIGSVAVRLRDFFPIPYSSSIFRPNVPVAGVEVQANFISQILNVALDNRPILQIWPDPIEGLWILAWSYIGASLSWKFKASRQQGSSLLGATAILAGSCYIAFLWGWWLPLVPPAIALAGSAIAITSYLARQEEELKRSKEFLHKVIDAIPDPVFVKDKHHRWIVLNRAYCNLIGRPLDTLLDKSDYDVFPEWEANTFRQQDELIFLTNESQESEEEFTDARGVTHLIATKRSLHKDAAGNLFLVGIIRDITQRKRIEEELKLIAAELAHSNQELKLSEDRMRYLAYHDHLTGLANRKQFEERLSQTIAWAGTNNQLVALFFLDLDGFKQINDTLGHDTGDLLLQAVAVRLTSCLRGSDIVARLGGDEFTVILPTIPSLADAVRVAEKILAIMTQSFAIKEHTIHVSTSIGISIYPIHAEQIDALIKNADDAMYRAKDLGKNRYEFC